MNKSEEPSRRKFIKQSAIAGAAMILPVHSIAENFWSLKDLVSNNLKVFIFSKHLQFLDYKNMSEASKEMGFDGVDLTLRPKGHVIPERVAEDLQRATEAMKSFDLTPQILSTNVSDANNPIHEKVLKTASQLGYQHYRTAWFKYNADKDIMETVDFAKKQLKGLAKLNKKLKIKGGYHNHSGHYFGAGIWDLYQALEKLSPNHIGSQYDIMHATVEGGKNWEIGFELIKPYINTIVVKDFVWIKKAEKWLVKHVPLGEGMVDFNKFFSLLKRNHINVPLSIHVEYDLGGAEHGGDPTINHREVFNRIKKDLNFVKKTWEEVS